MSAISDSGSDQVSSQPQLIELEFPLSSDSIPLSGANATPLERSHRDMQNEHPVCRALCVVHDRGGFC